MGIIRLTLLTAALLWLAMYYFGRDDGLPEDRLGRAPTEVTVTATTPAPADAAETAADDTPSLTPTAANAPAPDPEPTPVATPAPETPPESPPAALTQPEPAPEPEPQPAAEPEPAPAPEPVAREVVLYVTAQRVNVRTGPSTDFDVITSLPRGAAVTDLGDADDGWREVRLETGEIAFISGDFLSPDPQ